MRESREPAPFAVLEVAVTLLRRSSGVGAPRATWIARIAAAETMIAPNASTECVELRWKQNHTNVAAPAAISAPTEPDRSNPAATNRSSTYETVRWTPDSRLRDASMSAGMNAIAARPPRSFGWFVKPVLRP